MAAVEFTCRTTGFQELGRLLEQLPKRMSRAVRMRALKRSAEPLIGDARQRAAKATGALARSIGVQEMARRTHGAEVAVGPRDPKAHLIEFGTAERVVKSTGRKAGRVTPRPFMRPAWDSTKDQVLDVLRRELSIEVTKAVNRLTRELGTLEGA